jgi:hypothetical protein
VQLGGELLGTPGGIRELGHQPRRLALGVLEPIAVGAAALGVLEHRGDGPAVLSLQPCQAVEALVGGGQALGVGLEALEIGVQLGAEIL